MNASVQHGIANPARAGLLRVGFISVDSEQVRKSATVALPGTL